MEKKTSAEWDEIINKPKGIIIYDPDGWNRFNFQYSFHEEQITLEEFNVRMMQSTCIRRADK